MFEPFQFEGRIKDNHIVPNGTFKMPEDAEVKVSVEMKGQKDNARIRRGTQDFSDFFGSIVAPEPITVGNLSREEIYRDDD